MEPTKSAGLLVIGLDAADPEMLRAHCGRLPNIARLLKTGHQVDIAQEPGLYTGSVWPTLNSGMTLGRHGRYFFKHFDPKTYQDRRVLSEDLPVTPYWERASAAGRRVAVIDPPKTRLARSLNGIQVLDWTSHDPEGPPRSYPADEMDRLPGHADFGDRNISCDRTFRDAGVEPLLDLLAQRIDAKTDYALSVLDRGPWDLVTLIYNDTHCAGHQFWAAHDPGHPDHDARLVARIGDPLMRVLERVDAGIGKVLDRAGECEVLFFTSHGMGAHYDASAMLDEALVRIDGAWRAGQGGAKAAHRRDALSLARNVWRRAVPKPVRALFPGLGRLNRTIASDALAARRVFAVPSNDNAGTLRLNVKGREARGRVAQGAEAEEFIAYLKAELGKLRNAGTGSDVVLEITAPRPLSDSIGDDLPDLVIRWNREEPIDAITSDTIGTVRPHYVGGRSGDHRGRGLAVLSRRPDRAVAPLGQAQDIPATILHLLGLETGEIDGRSLISPVTAPSTAAERTRALAG